jgi:hypothetical protein
MLEEGRVTAERTCSKGQRIELLSLRLELSYTTRRQFAQSTSNKIQHNISLRLLGLSSGRFSTSFPTNSLCAFVVFPSETLAAEPSLASSSRD